MSTKPTKKWRFAIGTTSRVPDSGGSHYLIADFDDKIPSLNKLQHLGVKNMILQKTTHGWHLYTDLVIGRFFMMGGFLEAIGADPAWIEIGKKRGYYFLADKSRIVFPWPVEHMVIHYGKEKTQNT